MINWIAVPLNYAFITTMDCDVLTVMSLKTLFVIEKTLECVLECFGFDQD